MFNKKMVLSVLIIAFIGMGAAGTWATVNSQEAKATSAAISVEQPKVTLTVSGDAAKITSAAGKVLIGNLIFSPDNTNLKIVNEKVVNVIGTGPLADDIDLFSSTDSGVSFRALPDGFIGVLGESAGSDVTIPIYAEFKVKPGVDQTDDVIRSSTTATTFEITGIVKTV